MFSGLTLSCNDFSVLIFFPLVVSLGLTVGALPYQNPPHVSHSVPAGCRDGPPAAPPPPPLAVLLFTHAWHLYIFQTQPCIAIITWYNLTSSKGTKTGQQVCKDSRCVRTDSLSGTVSLTASGLSLAFCAHHPASFPCCNAPSSRLPPARLCAFTVDYVTFL